MECAATLIPVNRWAYHINVFDRISGIILQYVNVF